MVDDDKKKDLDEYSALSDALDSGEPAPSLEDLLKDHGIDLGSDMDLDAMQDFSLSESDKEGSKEDDLFSTSDLGHDDAGNNDHLFDDQFNDNLFDEPAAPIAASPPAKPRAREPVAEPMMESFDHMEEEYSGEPSDTNMFEASDFDDATAPEHHDLGGDPLFDYDPQGEATEATFADVGGAEGDLGGDGGMGGDMPPPDKAPGAKRIFARLGMMLVLVSVIYGGLRFFLAEKPSSNVANAPESKMPLSEIAHLTKSEHVVPKEETKAVAHATTPATTAAATTTTAAVAPTMPEMPAAPEMPAPAPAAATAIATPTPSLAAPAMPIPPEGAAQAQVALGQPANIPAPAPITTTTTTTTTTPAATSNPNVPDMHAEVASHTTALNISVPIESITKQEKQTRSSPMGTEETLVTTPGAPSQLTMGSGDVHNKLDNLELALKSIDQRLSQVGTGGVGDDKMQRLERLVSDANAPEMQDVLQQAVKKMKELDRKLERISELQHQVRMLDTDVKMLKEDVLTQTNMVGEQQRLFNDNVQISQMQEPGPVKMVVQAAIPGRAWLRSERGELLTVIPGDEVPGYGRVVSIDAASGTVVTSSRAVFREQ